jgi:hypothetical protein
MRVDPLTNVTGSEISSNVEKAIVPIHIPKAYCINRPRAFQIMGLDSAI